MYMAYMPRQLFYLNLVVLFVHSKCVVRTTERLTSGERLEFSERLTEDAGVIVRDNNSVYLLLRVSKKHLVV